MFPSVRPPVANPLRAAAHADTALYFGCRALEAAYAYLQDRGVAYYGMKQIYLWPATVAGEQEESNGTWELSREQRMRVRP